MIAHTFIIAKLRTFVKAMRTAGPIMRLDSPAGDVSIIVSQHYIRVVKDILCDVEYSTLSALLPSRRQPDLSPALTARRIYLCPSCALYAYVSFWAARTARLSCLIIWSHCAPNDLQA